jgi:hypothetical protein
MNAMKEMNYAPANSGMARSRFAVLTMIAVMVLMACAPSTEAQPTTIPAIGATQPPAASEELPSPLPTFLPSQTRAPTSILDSIGTTPVASPTSAWKEDWVDFTNEYYGYTISVPPSAIVQKNQQFYGYNEEDLPAGWDPDENFFDYLNMTYPPGTCVSIEYESAYIQIKAADSLGGKYAIDCSSFGGLGVANWVWTQETVSVAETDYTAIVVRQCDAQNENCSNGTYGIQIGDGAGFVLFNVGSSNQHGIFEILRSYRPSRAQNGTVLLKASSHASQTGHIRLCQRRSTPGVQQRT